MIALPPMAEKAPKRTARRLFQIYLGAVVAMLGTLAISFMMLEGFAKSSTTQGTFLRLADQQQMLSQRILYLAHRHAARSVEAGVAPSERAAIKGELDAALTAFADTHVQMTGDGETLTLLDEMVSETGAGPSLTQRITAFADTAEKVLDAPADPKTPTRLRNLEDAGLHSRH